MNAITSITLAKVMLKNEEIYGGLICEENKDRMVR